MPFSCFLFRPWKSCERRRKCSHTNVSNTLVARPSTPSAQMVLRSLSQAKAGTHPPLLKKSHTTAHTAKQGAFLPRPQRGLVLPVNSFLFRHAFIYIHFPVHCEPPLSAERKIRRNCRHKFYPQPFLIPVFNFLHKRPTFAFTSESGYTLGSLRKIAHKGTRGETGGVLGGGGITTLGALCVLPKRWTPACQNDSFAVFLVWLLLR